AAPSSGGSHVSKSRSSPLAPGRTTWSDSRTEARGLLDRGFARIEDEDRATGAWANDVVRLARAAARRDSSLTDLAAQVTTLAARHLGSGGP
ncbi:hypothetical protein AB0D31_20245, partial [Streptomyces sp. NPDC048361]